MGCTASGPATVYTNPQNASERYQHIELLGTGASGQVLLVKSLKGGSLYAMKNMYTNPYNKALYNTEVSILKKLRHAHIAELVSAYEDFSWYHIVTKYYQGGDLFARLDGQTLTEKTAALVLKEMLQAVAFCHENGVVHRDLKPENFVFEGAARGGDERLSALRLIDFGVAEMRPNDDDLIETFAGSSFYIAPEMADVDTRGRRTLKMWKAADVWALGVILFTMVTGDPPFHSANFQGLMESIRKDPLKIPDEAKLSAPLTDLLRQLLEKDHTRRCTAAQALLHPFFKDTPDRELPAHVLKHLSRFSKSSKLKKAVAHLMASSATELDQRRLQQAFAQFDKNGDGKLDSEEVQVMMDYFGFTSDDVKELQPDQQGNVSQKDFVQVMSVMQHTHQLERDSTLVHEQLFRQLDKDGDQQVSADELYDRLAALCSKEEAKEMVREVDQDGDGQISFTEWITAMRSMRSNRALEIAKK